MTAGTWPRRAVTLLAVVLLTLSGCGADNGGATTTATTPEAAATATARPLPAEWYEDPDGDTVSTFVEREIGSDPEVDECVRKAPDCGARR